MNVRMNKSLEHDMSLHCRPRHLMLRMPLGILVSQQQTLALNVEAVQATYH